MSASGWLLKRKKEEKKKGKEELDSAQDKSKGIYILMDAFINRHTCYCADLYSCIGTHFWQGTKISNLIEQP